MSDFRKKLKQGKHDELFFKENKRGRKESSKDIVDAVPNLRKLYYPLEDVKITLDANGMPVSKKTIYSIIHKNGFARLPRRQKLVKQNIETPAIKI